MVRREKTKLLIVDDSRVFRAALETGLSGADDIQVIGAARDGIEALRFIEKVRPDVITLDLEMPRLNGLGTLERIERINRGLPEDERMGVIMISSHTTKGADITMQALAAGAFDFIAKPVGESLARNIGMLCKQLLTKIRLYTSRRITDRLLSRPSAESVAPARPAPPAVPAGRPKVVVIGVSTGGPKALTEIMPSFCEEVDLPILIVQHMPPTFTRSLARSLDGKCRHQVSEAAEGDPVVPGRVYIAPGGWHMILERHGADVRLAITGDPPEHGCRPSADVLFRSAARIYGGDVVAVVMTGMGEDGADGAAVLKEAGAVVMAQDRESSVVWGMPGSAYAAGAVDRLVSLRDLPRAVGAVVRGRGTPT